MDMCQAKTALSEIVSTINNETSINLTELSGTMLLDRILSIGNASSFMKNEQTVEKVAFYRAHRRELEKFVDDLIAEFLMLDERNSLRRIKASILATFGDTMMEKGWGASLVWEPEAILDTICTVYLRDIEHHPTVPQQVKTDFLNMLKKRRAHLLEFVKDIIKLAHESESIAKL